MNAMNANAHAAGAKLAELYREIHRGAMSGVPICNEALAVEAIGFCEFGGYVVGVIVTPWFANLVAVASHVNDLPSLFANVSRASLRFPAGEVDFNVSELDGFGRFASCSLFSPMSEFADQDSARMAARAALDALFDSRLRQAVREKPSARSGLDRRALFGGRRRQERNGEAAP